MSLTSVRPAGRSVVSLAARKGDECRPLNRRGPLIGASSVSVQQKGEDREPPGDSVQILPPWALFPGAPAESRARRARRLKREPGRCAASGPRDTAEILMGPPRGLG